MFQPGNLFMSFAYNEAAANLITTSVLDPFGKIPEVKFCAVRMSAGGKPENADRLTAYIILITSRATEKRSLK